MNPAIGWPRLPRLTAFQLLSSYVAMKFELVFVVVGERMGKVV
jgi:hypothetical protein